jgi:hypothetical protein
MSSHDCENCECQNCPDHPNFVETGRRPSARRSALKSKNPGQMVLAGTRQIHSGQVQLSKFL